MKRRELIKGAAMVASMPVTRLAAAEMADPPAAAGGDRWRGLKAGVASYTRRNRVRDYSTYTGSPTSTLSNSSITSGTAMRTQP